MLKAFFVFIGRHPLATGAIGSFTTALREFCFTQFVRLADLAGTLTGFFGIGQFYGCSFTGKPAIGRMIFFAFG